VSAWTFNRCAGVLLLLHPLAKSSAAVRNATVRKAGAVRDEFAATGFQTNGSQLNASGTWIVKIEPFPRSL
jgi:hypothetical protein